MRAEHLGGALSLVADDEGPHTPTQTLLKKDEETAGWLRMLKARCVEQRLEFLPFEVIRGRNAQERSNVITTSARIG